mgnify:FL=1
MVGKVVHWYDKISVGVIKLSGALGVGDKVMVRHGEQEFEDTVESIQLDHQVIKAGKKGQEVAVKLSQKSPEGSEVYVLG